MTTTTITKQRSIDIIGSKISPVFNRDNTLTELDIPITAGSDSLDIDSSNLEVNRVYEFNFLDTDMVLWKSASGEVNIYQIVD